MRVFAFVRVAHFLVSRFSRLIDLCAFGQKPEGADNLKPTRLTRLLAAALVADFGWTKKAAWIDHMVVTGAADVAVIPDINDDLQRETSFYERALASAELAVSKLKALGVATRRPDDFYAEMVKSDEHMKRVRAELIFEQTKQETTDERRKAREQKQYGKQVQAEKIKERTLAKKDSIKNLDKWRKQRKRDGFEDNGAAPEGFDDEKRRSKSGRGGGQHGRSTPETRQRNRSRRRSSGSEVGRGYVAVFRARFSRALLTPETPATRTGGCGACCPHALTPSATGAPSHLRCISRAQTPSETPPVVDWSLLGRARLRFGDARPSSLQTPRRAEHIPLPGGKQRRCHYLSGQTMLMLFLDSDVDFFFPSSSRLRLSRRSGEGGFDDFVFDDFVALARALTRSVFSPPFPSPQLKKQNDKESARDMTGYKPSNFDKGFRDGKGWGDLVRRAASPRFPPSRRNAFDAAFRPRRGRALSPAAFRRRVSPPAAVKINRHL